jgi:phosphosulfolactate synthase
MYRSTGEVREGLVEEIRESGIDLDDMIFEAPQKSQQAWLVRRFSEHVSLGNIALEQVLGLQALRLGLRGDTIFLSISEASQPTD